MKHFLLILLLPALVLTGCSKDDDYVDPLTKITDPAFREYCERFDLNNDGALSPDEVKKVTWIELSSFKIRDVLSLEGIEFFTELTSLGCSDNRLENLDVSKCTKLTTLSCDNNFLKSLDVSKCTNLISLRCSKNKLTKLDISGCTKLTGLYCWDNKLTNLDVGKCVYLAKLYTDKNQLTGLDISNNTSLEILTTSSNPDLTEIIVWGSFDIANPNNSIATISKDNWTTFVKK